MSKNLDQVFTTNPITTNANTDLMYFMQSPYTPGTDAGMTYQNFKAQFQAPLTLPLSLAQGGTGQNLTAVNNAVFSMTSGGATQLTTTLPTAVQSNITQLGTQTQSLNMGTNTIIGVANPVNAADAVNLQTLQTYAQGLNPVAGCAAASTANLNATYNNGTAGVGATLTNAGSLAAFVIDGYSASVGDRILVKNQTSTFQNGIYTVTTVGSGAVAWVLTRATDYDLPSQISSGDLVSVLNGTTQAESSWLQTATVVTIGTSAITFTVFFNPQTYTGSTSITTLGTITTGTWTGTNIALANGGTNANLTASNGGIVWSNASQFQILAGVAAANRTLLSGNSATPAWSPYTIPATVGTARTLLVSNGTNFVNTTETWAVPGASGNVLTSDGTNWTSSATATAGRLKNIQVFTSTGSNTYTPSAGVNNAFVQLWGAGGGGGASNSASTGGGGGGAGSYAASFVAVSGNVTISIGTGGNGQAAGNGTAGTNGGNTTYNSTTIVANGGSFGSGGTPGAGGTAGTGTITMVGGGGNYSSPISPVSGLCAGGGSSPFNTPSPSTAAVTRAGQANTGQGGGAGDSAANGGAGGSGYAIVWEYS